MVGYPNLANIVERSSNVQDSEFFVRHTTTHPNCIAKTQHALGMKSCHEITVTQRNRQNGVVPEESGKSGVYDLNFGHM